MALDIFKDDVEEIKIRNNDYQIKVDKAIDNKIKEEDVSIASLNLLEMEEEKKIKKIPMTIYLEEEDLDILKTVSAIKKTTVSKTINTIIKATVNTTKSNLPADIDIKSYVKKYNLENKSNKNK